jgi:hypothetical protein
MKRLRAFAAFWYDFLIGDDWRVALLVATGLLATGLIAHLATTTIWWLLPVTVLTAVSWSLHRATANNR